MKKLLVILLTLSMLLLCACSASDSSGNSSPSGGDNPDSSYTGSISHTESKDTLESRSTAEEGPENSLDTSSASDRDEKNQEGNDPGDINLGQETAGKDKPKETLPSQSSDDDNSSESSKPTETTKPTEATKPQTELTESKTETTKPPAEETVPTEPRAGRNDTAAVAQRVLEYINQYRSSPATGLSGLTMKLATLVKNSPNHWNYIGDSQYTYIAVGVTYESDMWYCAITVASENTDEY